MYMNIYLLVLSKMLRMMVLCLSSIFLYSQHPNSLFVLYPDRKNWDVSAALSIRAATSGPCWEPAPHPLVKGVVAPGPRERVF